ncbi:AB hydrolase-1 domain-containing protein [Plasmodiophora brassicae]|uniref:AB hydrolase-1 domain-containing protein n=1 Tax=Plasmodiophora brassicae TaxID=37360 RepID=A0A0G4ITQ6_PLABS|nr:hypothetical protein PBRA_006683 [Plasmodiophora brassicae]SPQ95804.1 unnamed protein product [Plasmodiophora brassicae]
MLLELIVEAIGFGIRVSTGLLVLTLAAVWYYQDRLLYFPEHRGPRQIAHNDTHFKSPHEWSLPFTENWIATVDNVLLHSWLIVQDDATTCSTIVFFHGNAGNIGYRLPNAYELYRRLHVNVLLVDYRGYGNSEGTPNEKGLQLDAEAVLLWLASQNDQIDPDRIFLFGRSLGGAVALRLTTQNPSLIRGTIVENTFTTIDEMAIVLGLQLGVPFADRLRIFLAFFLSNHWNNEYCVTQVRTPLLFLSGLQDELVPPDHMKRLFNLATSETRVFRGYSGGHNDTYVAGGAQYYRDIADFLLSCETPDNVK